MLSQLKIEKVQAKIKKIKNALAADKRKWGGQYHDGRGLRYLPPELFLKIGDYAGALNYFKWFHKHFPDDSGYPVFLFEWTITLFKTNQIKEAEKMALETFMSNTYLFDKFFDKPMLKFDKAEHSNWEEESLTKHFDYSKDQPELKDFTEWLSKFITSDPFYKVANEFIEIEKQLKTESVGPKRSELVKRRYSLLDDY